MDSILVNALVAAGSTCVVCGLAAVGMVRGRKKLAEEREAFEASLANGFGTPLGLLEPVDREPTSSMDLALHDDGQGWVNVYGPRDGYIEEVKLGYVFRTPVAANRGKDRIVGKGRSVSPIFIRWEV